MWNLARFAIIIAFIKNEGGILTQFNEAVNSLSTIGGGGNSVLNSFDALLVEVSSFAKATSENVEWYAEWAINIMIWVGFGLMAIPIVLTFLLSKITLYFLLALSPIFFFMLMWGFLKDSFSQYATALLSNALALICINMMVQSCIEFIKEQTKLDGNPYLVSFAFLVFGVVAGMAVKYMVGVVNSVMRVSVERAGPGVIGAFKGAQNALQAPFTPTSNSIQSAQYKAASSQADTQKVLQDLAKTLITKGK